MMYSLPCPFKSKYILGLLGILVLAAMPVGVTPTENNGLRVLPAPGKMVVDGKIDDWDLSAGIFACDDVEHERDKYAI
jgi:hypothetical protein